MNTTLNPTPLWPILAGPIALGLALGFGSGVGSMLSRSLILPALVIGLSAALCPALYIGLSLSNAAPPARQVARSVVASLSSAGLCMVGLSPATLFLVASTQSTALVETLGATVIGGAAVLGMRQLWQLVFAEQRASALSVMVYGAWASVALVLGAKLLWRFGGFS